MKSFQEKEKKFYELLNKLNNFDVSQTQNKEQLEIEKLKDHKNQLEIEKNKLEEKYQSLAQELQNAQNKIQDLENSKKKDQKKQVEFGEFFKKITPIIEQYVSEKKIDIVLDRKNVFVASKKKDITQEIINIIDSKIK